ncbi:MAG: hypothetical protein VX075_09270 [Pseudomonadota bacterium]|nr:hypothetical protein [Pseudomonadota bacterium]MEC8198634.1 hypothetical protein [Pseudomonadota bacterium]MEC8203665.1 hypothetical protein [Pseudomonadota bacterium]
MIESRILGGLGTIPKPQFPITQVVMPSEGEGKQVGSHATCTS